MNYKDKNVLEDFPELYDECARSFCSYTTLKEEGEVVEEEEREWIEEEVGEDPPASEEEERNHTFRKLVKGLNKCFQCANIGYTLNIKEKLDHEALICKTSMDKFGYASNHESNCIIFEKVQDTMRYLEKSQYIREMASICAVFDIDHFHFGNVVCLGEESSADQTMLLDLFGIFLNRALKNITMCYFV